MAEAAGRWEDVAGQDLITGMLQNMLAGDRVPHAILFTGPSGTGKMLLARLLAAGLLCGGSRIKPCGTCAFCLQAGQGAHPDLTVLADDGSSLKIDQVRALQHQMALAPYHGGRRVFIIESAERLTTQAANSLLKMLEEPSAGTVLVLTAETPYALLPTLVSRCLQLPVHPLSPDILGLLLQAKGFEGRQAGVAARLGGGRTGAALALLAPDGLAARDQAAQIITALPNDADGKVWDTAARLDKLEAGELQTVLRNFKYILRDLYIVFSGQDSLILNTDIAADLRGMARNWDEARLFEAVAMVEQACRALEGNANPRLTCEALLIKLMNAAKGEKE